MCNVSVRGWVRAKKFDKKGKLVQIFDGSNLITSAGLALIAGRMVDDTDAEPSHMAIGSSAAVSTVAMTALQGTEHERVAFTTASHAAAATTYTASFGTGLGSTVTVNEVGIFNAASTGTMLARFLTNQFELSVGETFEVSWTLTFGD